MSDNQSGPGRRPDHRPRNVQPKNHDTYASSRKVAGTFVCESCGVCSQGGKWSWGTPPPGERQAGLCPACKRVRERYPAGTIRLPSTYAPHLEEIRSLALNAEAAEKAEHPLERMMRFEETEAGIVLETTGVHLARRITSKLERRFHKKARMHYPEEQALLFVELEP